MNRDSNVKALANTALATALSVIIAIIGLFVPVLALASLLWPVPVIVIVKRYGLKYGVYSTIASGLIVGMVSEPIYAAYVILSYGALGLSIGYGVHKNFRAGRILAITAVVSLLSKLLLMYAVTRLMGVNPLEVQLESMEKGLDMIGRMDLMVGVRLHSLIFSAIQGVPLVGISYDPKIDGFLARLGMKAVGNISDLELSDLLVEIQRVWSDRERVRAQMLAKMEEMRIQAGVNDKLVMELLNM
jgi:hypothetical protein